MKHFRFNCGRHPLQKRLHFNTCAFSELGTSFSGSVMTCRVLVKNYAKINSIGSSVTKLPRTVTAVLQIHELASASPTTSGSKHGSCLLGQGSVAELSPLARSYSRYPVWQSGGQFSSLSTHRLQAAWQHERIRCYCTQPRGEGSGATTSTQVAGESTEAPLSQREKLKRAVKEYGSTVIVFHITISLASLGGFYLAVSSGIDMVGILKSMGVGEAILQSKLATGTGTFVVAYAVHKVFAPVRIGITLTSTPFIVRYLRSKGILKPPKSKA